MTWRRPAAAGPVPARAKRRRLLRVVTGGVLAAALLLTAIGVSGAEDGASRLQLFLGRLHPLVVHLPIGFLLLAAALEVLALLPGLRRIRLAVTPVLVLGVLASFAAVAAGALLAGSGGYGGRLVELHRWLGYGVAGGALIALLLRSADLRGRRRWLRTGYLGALGATVLIVTAAGHLGGTLTRGPGYLSEYMPAPLAAVAALLPSEAADSAAPFTYVEDAIVYEHLVAPVLQARCVSCHGPDKQKGDLRLDSPEAILAGGTSGPVLTPGRAAESRMVQRVWLPPEHEEIMPPRGRQPLPAAEAELLRWWIDAGASFEMTMARQSPPPGVRAILEQIAGPPEERISPLLHTAVAPADSAALAAARASGMLLRPIASGSGFLRGSCVALGAECGREQLATLLPLAEQLVELDLGGAGVGDEEMETVGALRHLTRLDLHRTGVTDSGLQRLGGLQHLESLNLYGTRVSDDGLAALQRLASLRSLYLWETGASPAGAARLEEALPRLRVSMGEVAAAPAVEAEP